MPKYIFSYVRGLVQGHKITATALARQFDLSHDSLTRMLVSRFPWKQFLMFAIQRLFGILQGGYLIIDDTILAKPYGKHFTHASYVYSSSDKRSVFGYDIVMICWSNGILTIPLSWRWYKKDSHTRVELAMLLLEEIRWKWKIKNAIVLYDSWYAAAKIMRLVKSLGYEFVSQIKGNRTVTGKKLSSLSVSITKLTVGIFAGEVTAYYFKHEDKYYVTSIANQTVETIHTHYRRRWSIEEVFRFLKSVVHLEACQATRITAQKTHLVSCVLAYLIMHKEQQIKTSSLYQLQETWILNKHIGRCRINHYVKVLNC